MGEPESPTHSENASELGNQTALLTTSSVVYLSTYAHKSSMQKRADAARNHELQPKNIIDDDAHPYVRRHQKRTYIRT